jgi:hypothetical protein
VKPPPDSWWISFTYDAVNDIVDAAFRDVVLETDDDVLCWRREVERRFQRYGRPVDLIINLDGLIVKPTAARSFGAHRAEVLAENTRVSYRFNGNPQTRTSIYTSAVIHGADANIYESRDEALKALLANRETGAAPPARSPLGPSSQRGGPTPSQRLPAVGPPSHRAPNSSGLLSQRPPSSSSMSPYKSPSSPPEPVSPPPRAPASLPVSAPLPAPASPSISTTSAGPPSLRPSAVPKK